jgi:hypothetical protein
MYNGNFSFLFSGFPLICWALNVVGSLFAVGFRLYTVDDGVLFQWILTCSEGEFVMVGKCLWAFIYGLGVFHDCHTKNLYYGIFYLGRIISIVGVFFLWVSFFISGDFYTYREPISSGPSPLPGRCFDFQPVHYRSASSVLFLFPQNVGQ